MKQNDDTDSDFWKKKLRLSAPLNSLSMRPTTATTPKDEQRVLSSLLNPFSREKIGGDKKFEFDSRSERRPYTIG